MEREPHPINFYVGVRDQGVVAAGVLWCSQSPGLEPLTKGGGMRADGSR